MHFCTLVPKIGPLCTKKIVDDVPKDGLDGPEDHLEVDHAGRN